MKKEARAINEGTAIERLLTNDKMVSKQNV